VRDEMKLEFLGGRVYRLHVGKADRFDIVRYISDMYRSNPGDFEDVKLEVVYNIAHPLSTKDKNFIKWRIKSFTAGNITVSFLEEGELVSNDRDGDKVIPLKPVQSDMDMLVDEITEGVEESSIDNIPTLVLGTLRSGSEIDTGREVVILGDVHPGADIYTEGPVIILGTLSGRVFVLSDKAYVITKRCINGMIVFEGRAYECEKDTKDDEWLLFLPDGGGVEIYTDKIGSLARRVKRWLEE
jgi:septum formation inhibitor MinC